MYDFGVSIPYSSGEKCKSSSRRKSSIATMKSSFQSLIHQGKNARMTVAANENIVIEVSIPYSSGEKCKRRYGVPPVYNSVMGFNPLFIRGKMQVSVQQRYQLLLEYCFNPLFIRGKMQVMRLGAMPTRSFWSFNPLFIRGKMQDISHNPKRQAIHKGVFQSLIHQGKNASAEPAHRNCIFNTD